MGFILVNSESKRITTQSGAITPYFQYAIQSQRYIDKFLGGSENVRIIRKGD